MNQRPIGYEPTALTTELCPRVFKYSISYEQLTKSYIFKRERKYNNSYEEGLLLIASLAFITIGLEEMTIKKKVRYRDLKQ